MKIHLIIVLLLLTLICSGTSTTMSFTEGSFVSSGKTLRLSICDETGEKEEFDYLSVANNEQLFFIADPITKDEFSKRDSDIIKDIKIVQDDEKVSPAKVDFIKNEKDATVAILMAFNKSDLAMHEDMRFQIKTFTSEAVTVSETFRSEYHAYIGNYESGKAAFDNSDFLESYRQLQPFTSDEQKFVTLSFYNLARTCLDASVQQQVSLIGSEFNFLKLRNAERIERSELDTIDSLQVLAEYSDSLFSTYFNSIDAKQQAALQNISKELIEMYDLKYQLYMTQILSDFTQYDYRSAKFCSFMGGLTDLLANQQNILILSKPKLDIELLDASNKHLLKMREFSFIFEFTEFLEMVEGNILEEGYVFDEATLLKLQSMQEEEPEPYYNFFCGLNNHLAGEQQEFWTNMVKAMNKCTDGQLLQGIELITLFNDPAIIRLSNTDRTYFTEGLEIYISGNIKEIRHKFLLIKSLYPDLAVSYYILADIASREEDIFGAYFEYESVMQYKPEIITSYEFAIQQELDSANYPVAENKITAALVNHPAWKLYFIYANLLDVTGKYQEAIDILENFCVKINKNNYEEYLMLGDLYKVLGNREKARENYMEAGRINPTDTYYRECLKSLD